MVVLGLTGSVGMGKSAAADAFARLGAAVYKADEAVHRLTGPRGEAVEAVRRRFPKVIREGPEGPRVERAALAEAVFRDPQALRVLERIIHPLVRADEKRFLAAARRRGAGLAVLEIPLLFESGADRRCDATAVVSAPSYVQRVRVLRRRGMNLERLAAIRGRQMADREKRRRADFIIPTGRGRLKTLRAVREIIRILRARGGRRRAGSRRIGRPRIAGTEGSRHA